MDPAGRLAVLLACHNRRETTLAALDALHAQDLDVELSVFLVDDGSSDGTGEAVRARFPMVEVLPGTGDLYWVGAMRMAQVAARDARVDRVLWLNDDVVLHPSALRVLFDTETAVGCESDPVIVVGAVADPSTGRTTYSGLERLRRTRPLRFSRVAPHEDPRRCETFHGNVVLMSAEVADAVGTLDEAFIHTLADLDYGLRACRLGIRSWLAPGHVGTCPPNPEKAAWSDPTRTIRERFHLALSVKALPPDEWRVFARRYGGPMWPMYWLSPYVRIVTSRWSRRGGGRRPSQPAS